MNLLIIMVDLEFILRLLVAVGLGAIVGFERERKQKPAGLRTNILVCLGACLFTILSINNFDVDPARVAAGIVTGIGFLGAGSIIATGGEVVGLTTAATLWIIAGIGLAIGLGEYILGIITTIIVFVALAVKRK